MNAKRLTTLLLLGAATMFSGGLPAQVLNKRYPYVTTNSDGKMTVIVCREGNRGVKSDLIHPNWTTTPAHNELDATNNRFGAKFEVASTDASTSSTWDDAKTACQNYDTPAGSKGEWRLPTIRELRLICTLRGELTDANLPTDYYYWSATEASSRSGYACYVGFSEGGAWSTSESNGYRVRCIRDL